RVVLRVRTGHRRLRSREEDPRLVTGQARGTHAWRLRPAAGAGQEAELASGSVISIRRSLHSRATRSPVAARTSGEVGGGAAGDVEERLTGLEVLTQALGLLVLARGLGLGQVGLEGGDRVLELGDHVV